MTKLDTKSKIILLSKNVAETPLACIGRFKKSHPEFVERILSYAGRLDPMAEGLLIVLVGEENKKRGVYQEMKKEYEVRVLFGIQTDSYDILGKIVGFGFDKTSREVLQKDLESLIGKKMQSYPPYSSKPVSGKPLYYWAREGKLGDIKIPTKEIEIFSAKLMSLDEMDAKELREYVIGSLQKVTGEFRQEEIIKGWEVFFEKHKDSVFQTATIKIECSSGAYMRSIANDLGGLALSIKRTRVGDFQLNDALL